MRCAWLKTSNWRVSGKKDIDLIVFKNVEINFHDPRLVGFKPLSPDIFREWMISNSNCVVYCPGALTPRGLTRLSSKSSVISGPDQQSNPSNYVLAACINKITKKFHDDLLSQAKLRAMWRFGHGVTNFIWLRLTSCYLISFGCWSRAFFDPAPTIPGQEKVRVTCISCRCVWLASMGRTILTLM